MLRGTRRSAALSNPLPWWHPRRFAERRAFLDARARIATALRAFFAREEFVEVDTLRRTRFAVSDGRRRTVTA